MPVPVSLVRGSAKQIPFANAVFDTIATTWSLYSIPNPVAALVEMRRVLKPGGKLVFVEHGRAARQLCEQVRGEDHHIQ